MSARSKITRIFAQAGITVNGTNPWDIQVHDERLFNRLISRGSLGLGESYMDGWWTADELDTFFKRIMSARIEQYFAFSLPNVILYLKSLVFNMQTRSRSRKVAQEHYNLGNDLYMSFLDPYNQYTCGYFSDTEELNTAQEKKLQLICDKLQLKPTDRVLDIGCGWGGFCKYAAETIGCQVAGVSISNEQIAYAKDFCKGLPVDIQKKDYRDLNGTYDKILICGMIEHVGYKNYRRIMKKVYELLPDHGLFLLHTIGNSTSMHNTDPWIAKYIFPNSMIPSVTQLTGAAEGLFVMEDWHNFGIHYVSTLKAWCKNFEKNWDSIRNTYGDRFFRMWRYYLLSCAGYFDSRKGQLWQVVFSKRGVPGGYYSLR